MYPFRVNVPDPTPKEKGMARSIPLKTVELSTYDQSSNGSVSYAELLLGVLRANQPGGFSADELLEVLAVADEVKTAADGGRDAVLLEDAQYAVLAARVNSFRFAVAHEAVGQFIRDVREAETVNIALLTANGK